jgi:hypothetical protein
MALRNPPSYLANAQLPAVNDRLFLSTVRTVPSLASTVSVFAFVTPSTPVRVTTSHSSSS